MANCLSVMQRTAELAGASARQLLVSSGYFDTHKVLHCRPSSKPHAERCQFRPYLCCGDAATQLYTLMRAAHSTSCKHSLENTRLAKASVEAPPTEFTRNRRSVSVLVSCPDT